MWLKQSTSATIKVGPFVDATDGVTAETGLTIQKADVRLSKNGGNMAAASADQGASDAGAAHDELGYYDISLDATDTGTLGRLKVMISESGALPVWAEFMVVPAMIYDSIIAGTDRLDTNVTHIGDTAQTANDNGADINAILADTGELQGDWADGGRLDLILDARASQSSVDTIDNFLDTEIAAILAAVDTEVAAILADTNELQTDWADGGRLDLILDARASQASVDAVDNFIDTEIGIIVTAVGAIETDTQDIQSRLPASLNNGCIAADVQRVNNVEITGDGDANPFDVA